MILAPLHPAMLPLAVAIWSVDAFLWIVVLRLSLSRARPSCAVNAYWAIGALTDPARRAVQRGVFRLGASYCPIWLSWIVLIVALLTAHHLLLWLALSTVSP